MRQSNSACNLDYFRNLDSADKSYWLGFISADGYLYKDYKQAFLRVALSSVDSAHLHKLADIFKKKVCFLSHVDKRTNISYYQSRLTVFGNELYEDLVNHIDSISDDFCYINSSFHSHFMRGYFDGDGTVSLDNYGLLKFGYCSQSKEFLNSIMDIFCSNTKLKRIKILKIKGKRCYEFRWHGKNVASYFYNWLYKDSSLYLERKHNIFMNYFIRNDMI